jgi:hypothetical protein
MENVFNAISAFDIHTVEDRETIATLQHHDGGHVSTAASLRKQIGRKQIGRLKSIKCMLSWVDTASDGNAPAEFQVSKMPSARHACGKKSVDVCVPSALGRRGAFIRDDCGNCRTTKPKHSSPHVMLLTFYCYCCCFFADIHPHSPE